MKNNTCMKIRTLVALLACLSITQFMTGCSSPAVSKSMAVKSAQIVKKHPYSIGIEVSGGKETDAMGASQISNQAFQDAIAESITDTKLFNAVSKSASDYKLYVVISGLDQPSFGFDMTVKMEAGWRLVRMSDKKVVWQKLVNSSFTATVSDAFAAVERLRLASEGAAKANIKQAIEEMSQLSL